MNGLLSLPSRKCSFNSFCSSSLSKNCCSCCQIPRPCDLGIVGGALVVVPWWWCLGEIIAEGSLKPIKHFLCKIFFWHVVPLEPTANFCGDLLWYKVVTAPAFSTFHVLCWITIHSRSLSISISDISI